MNKISIKSIAEFKLDSDSRRGFLKSSFRYSGPGAIVFIISIGVILYRGLGLGEVQAIVLFLLAGLGIAYEFVWFVSARMKKPICKSCGNRFEKYLNSDRPNDTEYLYVCNFCCTYFSVLHGEESDW